MGSSGIVYYFWDNISSWAGQAKAMATGEEHTGHRGAEIGAESDELEADDGCNWKLWVPIILLALAATGGVVWVLYFKNNDEFDDCGPDLERGEGRSRRSSRY